MEYSRARRKEVYLSWRHIFSIHENERVRNQKAIRAVIQQYRPTALRNNRGLVEILQYLLKDGIFGSERAAAIAFPEMFNNTRARYNPETAPWTQPASSSVTQTSLGMAGPSKELMDCMRELYSSQTYSDLVISCGGKHYKVHKAIICPRSKFFAKACSGHFKEGSSGTVELPEDDPHIVDIMIYYLYHLDYDASSLMRGAANTEDGLTKDISAAVFAPQPRSPALVIHAKVYALAEKYFIDSLKALATQKFETVALKQSVSVFGHAYPDGYPDGLVEAMQEVYTSTVDTDRSLRDIVIKALHKHRTLLDSVEARDALKEMPGLTYELLMYVHKEKNWY
ncbi:BTB/POZ protein [Biscogniauxia mediterranea]|nr:BTB/POZ protein [Biscogniauxia mediterranea]